jgi:hypothetical protein
MREANKFFSFKLYGIFILQKISKQAVTRCMVKPWQLDSSETGVRLKSNFYEFSRNNDYNMDLDLNKTQDLSTTCPSWTWVADYKYRPKPIPFEKNYSVVRMHSNNK